MEAKYYQKKLTKKDILNLSLPNEDLLASCDVDIDFTSTQEYVGMAISQDLPKAGVDVAIAKELYQAIQTSQIKSSFCTDMRFWQWVSLYPMQDYVNWRWSIDLENKSSHYSRFLGTGGIRGLSQNAIARIYTPASLLIPEPEGDELLISLFDKAQKEMSIFQSESCLNRKVLIAVVKATRGKNQQNSKKDIMKLNALKYTKCFELMSEEEIIDLLI
jgi:hypothetical protein